MHKPKSWGGAVCGLLLGFGMGSPQGNGLGGQLPLAAQGEPSDPPVGQAVLWVSNGTGAGDAGDLLVKINQGGTTKTATLADWSGL